MIKYEFVAHPVISLENMNIRAYRYLKKSDTAMVSVIWDYISTKGALSTFDVLYDEILELVRVSKLKQTVGIFKSHRFIEIIRNGKTLPSILIKETTIREKVTYEVYQFKTEYPQGFTSTELETLIAPYKDKLNMQKYEDALTGITCMLVDGKTIIYHCDIITALVCGLENRSMYPSEMD